MRLAEQTALSRGSVESTKPMPVTSPRQRLMSQPNSGSVARGISSTKR